MKLKLIMSAAAFISFQSLGNMWGLCPGTPVTGMIPCDTACFGKAAIDLGVNVSKSEAELQSEFTNNSKKWADLNSTFVDVLTNYSEQKSNTHLEYIKALNGLSYKISGGLEQKAKTVEKNNQHLVTSYKSLMHESLMGKQVLATSLDYGVKSNGLKGEQLVLNQNHIGNFYKEQESKKRIPVLLDDQRLHLSNDEVANYILNDFDSTDELKLNKIGLKLAERSLSKSDFDSVSLKLIALYSGDSSNKESLKNTRAKFAINALLGAISIDDKNDKSYELSEQINQLNLSEDLSGSVKFATSRILKEEVVYTQAVSNVLLNELLTIKRDRNALSASHYSSGF